MPELLLILAFALVAFVYASVGFGGGSSYLALLALAALPFQEIRFTALLCNVIVVLGNSVIFAQNNQLNWRKDLPLIAASVPLAFLGAMTPIREKTFFLLLGVLLIGAALLLWFQPEKRDLSTIQTKDSQPVRDGVIGGIIGFMSGLVGIGGGIFLSPVLHFLRWDFSRKIAATASLYILVNSMAGLAGQLMSKSLSLNWLLISALGMAVLVGGQLGMRISIKKFSPVTIRKLTAGLVLFAGLEILWKHITGN